MDDVKMQVSGICIRENRKTAYVTFSVETEDKYSEWMIPECRMTTNRGFTDEETAQLELYIKMNMGKLKKKAASIDPLRVLMGKV